MRICHECYSLNVINSNRRIECNDCGYCISNYKFDKIKKELQNEVQLGYQYNIRHERDLKSKIYGKKYALKELSEIFTFLALATLNGAIGNIAYDKLKDIINKLKNDPIIIEIDDIDFKRFLKSETQQKKFIKYIQEYRDKKLSKRKKIKNK